MAKKAEQTLSYTSLCADIRAGRFAPVYLLMGEESYYIDKLVELLSERVVSEPDARDFDLHNFFGADSNLRGVIDTARRYPIMGDKQLVMLREAQSMPNAKNELDKLTPYIEHAQASTVLVITYKAESLRATSAIVKAIKQAGGIVFDSPKVKEWSLTPLITDFCKEAKVSIEPKAAEMIKEFIGNDLARIFAEIEKLIVATHRAPITAQNVETYIGISKDYNNFELVSAIAARDYAKCMRIVKYFEQNPKQNPVIVTTALIFRYFSNLMIAHYAPDKSERALMMHLGFHSPVQMRDITAGMRNYRAASCMAIIHALRTLDCRSKGIGSMQKDYAQLQEFIYKMFTL